MAEFDLDHARLKGDDWSIEFRKNPPAPNGVAMAPVAAPAAVATSAPVRKPKAAVKIPEQVIGTPISSPMTGIYYSSPSPGSPPFVKEGDAVTAGQVVGLIEAMKVFNEITSGVTGVVKKVKAESGQLVQPGDVLLLIG